MRATARSRNCESLGNRLLTGFDRIPEPLPYGRDSLTNFESIRYLQSHDREGVVAQVFSHALTLAAL